MRRHALRASLALCCLGATCGAAQAQAAAADGGSWWSGLLPGNDGGFWRLVASPYTVHYHKDDSGEHEPVYMIGLQRQRPDGWVWGGTYFSNSFGQPSAYVFGGKRFYDFTRWHELYAEATVGVLYGYVAPYEDKVPFNYNGFSPGAVLSLGWQFTKDFSMQLNTLGAAGLMFQFSIDLH